MGEKNNMIPDEQLKEWKEAEQYLTPSPWHYDSNNKLSDSNHKSLIDRDGYFKKFNDVEFCSRARKYFPLLIQAYEEQRDKIQEQQKQIDQLNLTIELKKNIDYDPHT